MSRGFKVVKDEFRKNKGEIKLPQRATKNSAGYDVYTPCDIVLKPNEKKMFFTDIKAYMQEDEVLYLHIRSSLGAKKGIVLSNITGVIDSDYYENKDNDGNIGLPLWNTSDETVEIKRGERVCQFVFSKYLVADNDDVTETRNGGFGSSGK